MQFSKYISEPLLFYFGLIMHVLEVKISESNTMSNPYIYLRSIYNILKLSGLQQVILLYAYTIRWACGVCHYSFPLL